MALGEKISEDLDISRICWQIGQIYFVKSEPNKALNYAQKSLKLQKKLDNQLGIAASLTLLGGAYYSKGEFDQALKFCRQSLKIKEISERTKLDTLQPLTAIYREKGELSRAVRWYNRAIKLAEKLNYTDELVLNLLGIGVTYRMMGEHKKAIFNLKRSLTLSVDSKYLYGIIPSLFYLVLLNLDKNSRKEAQRYLEKLEEHIKQTETKIYTQAYLIAKSLVLKTSGRIRNRTEAEILLKQIAEDDFTPPQLHLLSLINLCDLILEELYITNNPDILDEISPLINKIFEIAEKKHSYLWLTETKLLQAKLALIQMNIEEAKNLFTQAQNVAEMNGLNLLAIKISSEYDNLLEQLSIWDTLKKKDAPMSERMKLASLSGVIDRMLGKRAIVPPKLHPEEPVLLLIITQGGIPLFSNPFTEELTFEHELIGSFLTAFNDFSGEFFSKGLDRAKFGDYKILLESLGDFSACYLFKGQTYLAKKKLKKFVERIQDNTPTWQTLNRFYELNQLAELKDIPYIETLINEIFISKSLRKAL
ncbi:MAG: tetratricopeptide repeat protein [Candidatus Hodarchaeota archaeon]